MATQFECRAASLPQGGTGRPRPVPQGGTSPTSHIRTQPDFVHYSSMEAMAGAEFGSAPAERVARCKETPDALHEYGSVSKGLLLRERPQALWANEGKRRSSIRRFGTGLRTRTARLGVTPSTTGLPDPVLNDDPLTILTHEVLTARRFVNPRRPAIRT